MYNNKYTLMASKYCVNSCHRTTPTINPCHNRTMNSSFERCPRENPGTLRFYYYDYNSQTKNSKPISHPGRGWSDYHNFGNRGYYR